jgi:hypothetical protein
MAEFWGLIVKGGETKNVAIPDDHVLTVANVAFVGKTGETGKLYAGVDKKYVLATLSSGRTEQVSLDVTFFTGNPLSFGVDGNGEVHLVGALQYTGEAEDFDSEDEERAMRAGMIDDEASEDEDGSDEDGMDDEDDEDEEDESEEGSEEEAPAPQKALPAPKAAAAAAKKGEQAKAPQQQAKAKEQATPAKKGEQAKKEAPAATTPAAKKEAAAATPGKAAQTPAKAAAATPAKGGEKRPATAGKADGETPAKKAKADAKSPGAMCTLCNKPMPNQQALDQHTKAKHKQ